MPYAPCVAYVNVIIGSFGGGEGGGDDGVRPLSVAAYTTSGTVCFMYREDLDLCHRGGKL